MPDRERVRGDESLPARDGLEERGRVIAFRPRQTIKRAAAPLPRPLPMSQSISSSQDDVRHARLDAHANPYVGLPAGLHGSPHAVLPDDPWRDDRREPASPVEDVGRYAYRLRFEDDYRHRMVLNILTLVFVMLLVGSGVWIANTMAQIRKNEDCVLSGRRNCALIELSTLKH